MRHTNVLVQVGQATGTPLILPPFPSQPLQLLGSILAVANGSQGHKNPLEVVEMVRYQELGQPANVQEREARDRHLIVEDPVDAKIIAKNWSVFALWLALF